MLVQLCFGFDEIFSCERGQGHLIKSADVRTER